MPLKASKNFFVGNCFMHDCENRSSGNGNKSSRFASFNDFGSERFL